MKILILSDIHANLTALDAVLSDAGSFDATWCLGDVIGYGPDPNECVALVRELPALTCLTGNHDAAVLGEIDVEAFNYEARVGVMWTKRVLNGSNARFLRSQVPMTLLEEATLAHGSPRSPIWEYILDTATAAANFEHFKTPFCFVGHTHVPAIFKEQPEPSYNAGLLIPEPNSVIQLEPRMIVNPGSVGQPRDRDPRAAYALLDTETWQLDYRRVPYDVEAVQQRMREAGLPERHIQRLAAGW